MTRGYHYRAIIFAADENLQCKHRRCLHFIIAAWVEFCQTVGQYERFISAPTIDRFIQSEKVNRQTNILWQAPSTSSSTSSFTSIHFRSHQSGRARVAAGLRWFLCVCDWVCALSCAVKFHCQRKSSLTRLQQTRYDSVQWRPNRAAIQLPATGSLLLTQSPLTARPPRARKEGSSAPWKSTSHVPVSAASDVCLLLPPVWVHRQEVQCPLWPAEQRRGRSPIWGCSVSVGTVMISAAACGRASFRERRVLQEACWHGSTRMRDSWKGALGILRICLFVFLLRENLASSICFTTGRQPGRGFTQRLVGQLKVISPIVRSNLSFPLLTFWINWTKRYKAVHFGGFLGAGGWS